MALTEEQWVTRMKMHMEEKRRRKEEHKQAYDVLRFANMEAMRTKLISEAPFSPLRHHEFNPYTFITSAIPSESPRPPDPPDFPIFDGTRVREWINSCEQFFYLHNTLPEHKSRLASLHTEDEALKWNRDFIHDHYGIFPSWPEYFIVVSARFRETCEDPQSKLVSLQQSHEFVENYRDSFECALTRSSSQHMPTTNPYRASFNPYQNYSDKPHYKSDFGNYIGPEIEFDRESDEIEVEELQDKQPEEDVETLIINEDEQLLECVDEESSIDGELSEVIAETPDCVQSPCNHLEKNVVSNSKLCDHNMVCDRQAVLETGKKIKVSESTETNCEAEAKKGKNSSLGDDKVILALAMKECAVGKVDMSICDLEFDRINFSDKGFDGLSDFVLAKRVWEPGGMSARGRAIKLIQKVHNISFQGIAQESSHVGTGTQMEGLQSYFLVNLTSESQNLLLVKSYLVSNIRVEDTLKGARVAKFTVEHFEYLLASVLTFGILHSPRPPDILFCKEVSNCASRYIGVDAAFSFLRIFYGPFLIIDRVGSMAYKLELPHGAAIHNVFHVSQLKLCPNPPTVAATLPQYLTDVGLSKEPERILETKMVKRQNAAVTKVLVQWKGYSPEQATWEFYQYFIAKFPEFHS